MKVGDITGLAFLGIGAFVVYKFIKGDWKLPNLGSLFDLGDMGSIPNIVLDIATPGIDTMPPISDLQKQTTGELGIMYNYDTGAIIAIEPDAPFPGIGNQEAPGQIVQPPGKHRTITTPVFEEPQPGEGFLEPNPYIEAIIPPKAKANKKKGSYKTPRIVPTEKQIRDPGDTPISYAAPKIKEAIVKEKFGGTKLGELIVGAFK